MRTWLGRDHPDVDAVIDERVERYRAAVADGSSVYEHTREAVRYAAERVPVAICSGAARAEIEPVVEAAGLAPLLRGIVSSDDVVEGKPDPEGYLKALAIARRGRGGDRWSSRTPRRGSHRRERRASGGCSRCAAPLDPARLAEADELIERIDVDVMRRLLG